MASYRKTDLAATATLVTGSPCALQWAHIDNSANSAKSYLQFYDAATAGAVTVGTTTPKYSLLVPASGGYDTAIGSRDRQVCNFTNGIVIAATTTVTGNTAPSASVLINMDFS